MAKPRIWTEEYIIGVDEAGRGPLAGPVAVGVSLIEKSHQKAVFALLKKHGLNDSKQVTEADREKLYELLTELKKDRKVDWHVILVSAQVISEKGIVFAVKSGIDTCLKKIESDGIEDRTTLEMDGALKVPPGDWKKSSIIIKGDSIKPSIMIASIIAKVTRDRYMLNLAEKYPQYGFEKHKGYGTKKHREAIAKHGECDHHRVGWFKKSIVSKD